MEPRSKTPQAWLCSYPKSGRTWMRFALANLIDEVYGLEVGFDTENMFQLIPNDDGVDHTRPWKTIDKFAYGDRPEVPLVAMSHLPWEARFSEVPVVLLIRNPAASLVSRFFHVSRHAGRFDGDLSEFAREEFLGVPGLVSYFASWQHHLDDSNVEVVTYEELRSDPIEPFSRIVRQLGVEADEATLERALEAASVDRMRSVERRSGVGQPNQYDRSDPGALRVRRAGTDSWREEIDSETLDFLIDSFIADPAASALLDRYGIAPTRAT